MDYFVTLLLFGLEPQQLLTNENCSTRQGRLEVMLEHDAARTRRASGIGPWQPEAYGRDRKDGRRRLRRGAQIFSSVLRQAESHPIKTIALSEKKQPRRGFRGCIKTAG
jgi:hypothetical protein